VPDKNAEVDCVNSIVEHGIGNQAEVRNDYDTVERTGEEHKDARIKYEVKVHALNIVTRKLDTNCNKGRNSDAPERSNTKSTNTEEREAALALIQAQLAEQKPVSGQQREGLSGAIDKYKSHFTKKQGKCKNFE
jgi:hypothetical protein